MKYFVSASGGPGFASPEEALKILEKIVLPSFEMLIQLEGEKRILGGGLPVGERSFVFIMEASSNEELDAVLRKIPTWGSLDWEVTPLTSFANRAATERQAVKELKKA
jgi:hypothetical protein